MKSVIENLEKVVKETEQNYVESGASKEELLAVLEENSKVFQALSYGRIRRFIFESINASLPKERKGDNSIESVLSFLDAAMGNRDVLKESVAPEEMVSFLEVLLNTYPNMSVDMVNNIYDSIPEDKIDTSKSRQENILEYLNSKN